MRYTKAYIPTLKEAPSDAEVISHKLLLRAGMIRKLTSGIYNWLPLGLRSLQKASNIVREEMNAAGSEEILMPFVQPADLWQESGRWAKYGKELLRIKDRHERDYCLGPTHEEVITDLLRNEVRSYRQLPINLYQIQTKFRDEIRPRFGLMRGREFLMKDAYSFDADDEGADKSYAGMREAYNKIFSKMGLNYRMVEADSGAIGGSFSHEFMVLAETGEDIIVSCTNPDCAFAANLERCPTVKPKEMDDVNFDKNAGPSPSSVHTPNVHSVEEIANFLKVETRDILKSLLLIADGKPIMALLQGDRELNIIKLKNLLDVDELEFASPEQVLAITNTPVGFVGPVNTNIETIIADYELYNRNDWIIGANKKDTHIININVNRDCKVNLWADIRNAQASDSCPKCNSSLELNKGIEVGHIFKLGTKYSSAMKGVYVGEDGEEYPIIMGCYGIGVSRIIAASIEQNNDENGIVFPPPLAPYEVIILNLDPKNDWVSTKADEVYNYVKSKNIDVLYDDREERPGIKFKDADLMGIPLQIIIGGKSLDKGIMETKIRKLNEKSQISAENYQEEFDKLYKDMLTIWNLG